MLRQKWLLPVLAGAQIRRSPAQLNSWASLIIVHTRDNETGITEYLEALRKALEYRGMRVGIPRTLSIDFKFGQDNGQGRERVTILEERCNMWLKRGGAWIHGNVNYTERECSVDKLLETQRNVV